MDDYIKLNNEVINDILKILSNQQDIINELITRIESLENN